MPGLTADFTADFTGDFDAILLTGGSARRLGGIDKATLEIAGSTCFIRVLEAVSEAKSVVVVGPAIPANNERIVFIQEEPRGGGPVAGLWAALPFIKNHLVAVISIDVPLVAGAIDELRASWSLTDVALVASDGTDESYLVSIFNTDALRQAISQLSSPINASMKSVLAHIAYRVVIVSDPDMLIDVDTPEDVKRVEEVLSRRK